MTPKVTFSEYDMDPTIPTAFIKFGKYGFGYFSEYDVPEEIMCIIRKTETEDGKINWIEIINPEEFMKNDYFDEFEVQGYNIKKLIGDSYKKELSR